MAKDQSKISKSDKSRSSDRLTKKRFYDFRKMSVWQRYLFLGVAIIGIVMLCFLIGLGVDYLLQQPATVALWGIGIGTILAMVFSYRQLIKIVDVPVGNLGAKKASRANNAKLVKRSNKSDGDGLSVEERQILAESQMLSSQDKDKSK